jgi:hypothetical protein
MRRKRVIVGVVGLAMLASPWLAVWLFADRPNVFERADRLQKGMTEAEVVSGMGRPPDRIHEDVKYGKYHFRPDGTRVEPDRVRALEWSAGERSVWIIFWEGRAIDRWEKGERPQPIQDHIRRWLGL